MASIFKRKGKGRFVIQYTDHLGVRKEKASKTTDKRTAQALANKLESDAMLRRVGVIDPQAESFVKKSASPLQHHIDVFKAKLHAEGRSEKHIRATVSCIDRVVAALSLKTVGQLTLEAVMSHAASLRTSGRSPRTIHATLTALKALTKWLTLMRHSTITLTMDTYGHLFPGQDAETVHRLPDMTKRPDELPSSESSENSTKTVEEGTAISVVAAPSRPQSEVLG
jgi:hypothetical protein